MKRFITLLIIAIIALTVIVSCSEERSMTENATRKTLELPDRARENADLMVLRNAVSYFKATKDRNPRTLKEAIELSKAEIQSPLSAYEYDAQTGEVTIKNK